MVTDEQLADDAVKVATIHVPAGLRLITAVLDAVHDVTAPAYACDAAGADPILWVQAGDGGDLEIYRSGDLAPPVPDRGEGSR